MGICTSHQKEPPQAGPAPVKGPSPASAPAGGAGVGPKEAPRTVTVNGASKPTEDKETNGGAAKSKPGELKGAARYEISPGTLGKGHFAVVKKCRDLVTGQTYAVKIIDKKEMVKSSASVVKQEIEILKAVGAHPNIVQLIDHYEDATKHYLVLELCLGGDLFSQIVEHGKYSEAEAAVSCRQLADALRHIHKCGVVHRDLKPENILLVKADPSSPLKLADFGLSKLIKGHLHPMRTVCGTWAYCVAGETKLREVTTAGVGKSQMRPILARDVTRDTVLVDELYRPVGVKAIHTTERSVDRLWTVKDAETNEVLFRCTPDHKLSLLETPQTRTNQRQRQQQQQRRVEIRCSEFAAMSPVDQSRFVGYTASPHAHPAAASPSSASLPSPSALKHIGRTFPLSLLAPLADAPLERFIGIEVASATHRYMLDSEVVTSNCAPEVIKRKPYDSTVDNWTLGVLMYILLSGYHPFDVYGEMPEPELLQKIITCSYDFDDPVWATVSQSAKDLIKGLLQLDPAKRLSLDSYLNSDWIRQGNPQVSADGTDASGTGGLPLKSTLPDANNTLVVERLAKFGVGKTKFRAVGKAVVASNKFKASLNNRTPGSTPTPLLSNGEPDYLGLGSGPTSMPSSPFSVRTSVNHHPYPAGSVGLGLESVREGEQGLNGLGPISSRTHEPSSSDQSIGSHHNGDRHHKNAVSMNQIDASAGTVTNRSERGGSVEDDGDDLARHSSGASALTIHEQQPSPLMAARPMEVTMH